MQDLAFADATRPTPRRILGIPLLDYSLGHELLLQRSRNALVFNRPDELRDDQALLRSSLIEAVSICSRTWSRNRQRERRFRLWLCKLKAADLTAVALEFSLHRMEGSTHPVIHNEPTEGEPGRHLGAPFLARVANYAGRMFGLDAFDQPLGMLQWLYFTHLEDSGACGIANDLEIQIAQEIAQHQADYDREQREAQCQH